MMKKASLRIMSVITVVLTVLLDTLSKNLAIISLKDTGETDFALIPGILHFTYHENKGAAFGMLSDSRWVFMSISSIAIIAIAVYLFCNKENSILLSLSLSMILGGGIGNMIDRVCLGYVVDFINFKIINFPIFNIADTFVTIGAALLISYLFKQDKDKDTQGIV